MPTLGEIGEFEAIRRLDAVRRRVAGVRVGPGDDAAVLETPEGRDLVVTTDAFVAGRHYDPAWCPPEVAGRRLAVANLSDLAAMGAAPCWAFHSAGVTRGEDIDTLVGFERGLVDALDAHHAAVVGGNLTAVEHETWHSVTLIGHVLPGRAWTRGGARPGDWIAITGSPGRSAAGCRLALERADAARDRRWAPLIRAWTTPPIRLPLALTLAEAGGVGAAIDLSDGFAGDLAHVCEASGVTAEIDEASWPEDPLLEEAAKALESSLDALRFGPSDDYELLLAVRPEARAGVEEVAKAAGESLWFVGRFKAGSRGPGIRRRGGRIEPLGVTGFDHYRDDR